MQRPVLVIDQGTTSSRAIIFQNGKIVNIAQQEFTQHFPQVGWVEHDSLEIWTSVKSCCDQVLSESAYSANDIAAIGITNQRETIVAWDRATGEPVYNAIVWQDRRTAKRCAELKRQGLEERVQKKTGLLLDPYFSSCKIQWIFDNVPQASALMADDRLALGTMDTWILWNLTEGQVHATDASNASRTMLYNIHNHQWDDELLELFGVPNSPTGGAENMVLPEVKNSSGFFGTTTLFGAEIPITAMIGDQQSALVGQACFAEGMVKSTYGTGCFMVANTGEQCVESQARLLSTIAYQIDSKVTYALEGSIFIAGAAVQWLRDKLGIIHCAEETEAIAKSCEDTQGVYLVPAFTGLGAPHWKPEARASLVGMTRDSGKVEIVTAALQSVAYQTYDLLVSMTNDGVAVNSLRVDGGMVANDWLLAFLADILDVQVERPEIIETTALGAAYLAALHIGEYESLDDIAQHWQPEQRFQPSMPEQKRQTLLSGWQQALESLL